MFRSLFSRSLAALLVIVMLATQLGTVAFAETYAGTLPVDTGEKTAEEELAEVKALLSALSYQEYLDEQEVPQNGKDDMVLTYADVVADKHLVNDVVKRSDEQSQDTGDGKLEQQLGDAFVSQCLYVFHILPPFRKIKTVIVAIIL